jgi:hypothetical protein
MAAGGYKPAKKPAVPVKKPAAVTRLTPNQADNQAAKNAAIKAQAPKGADALTAWLAPKTPTPAAVAPAYVAPAAAPFTPAPFSSAPVAQPVAEPAAAAATPVNFDPNKAMNDPIYQYYMNEALGDFRGQSVQENERLSNLYTGIYGETGQLKNFDTQATQDQRRLAAEMAGRGTLRSGAYAGGERGLGTQQQKEQASNRTGIEKGYSDQTSPQALFDQGLTRGPDKKVRELVQGEDVSWTDPATGETKTMKYDWTKTTAGRAAKQAALAQWMSSQLAGVTSVM